MGPAAFLRSIGESVQFSVRWIAWPIDSIKIDWFRRYTDAFSKTQIVELIENSQSNILKLNNLRINQTGIYVFRITAGGDLQQEVLFSLLVLGQSRETELFITKSSKTSLKEVEDGRFLEFGNRYDLFCISEGSPLPEMKIMWNPCVRHSSMGDDCEWSDHDENGEEIVAFDGDFRRSIRLKTRAQKSGRYACQVSSLCVPVDVTDTKADVAESISSR